jgi:hypothetical protein
MRRICCPGSLADPSRNLTRSLGPACSRP